VVIGPVTKGETIIELPSFANLPKGLYILELNNGQELGYTRLIIN